MTANPALPSSRVSEVNGQLQAVKQEIAKVIVGQETLLDRMLIALLANGHLLVEGVPGLAKTTAIKTLAEALGLTFRRVSFTPDLLPADIIGTLVFNPRDGAFTPRLGPVFTHLLLADEINRAPAKVQSALLEAMQERQVTIGDATHPLPSPFFVLATQNPIEQEGTYPLPEAQMDRFMMKCLLDYPTKDEERRILQRFTEGTPAPVRKVLTAEQILQARDLLPLVYCDEKVSDYVLDIVACTRKPAAYGLERLAPQIAYGASPRASLTLSLASRAHAILHGRPYVTPQDVKTIAPDVLRHRVLLTYEAEAEERTSDHIIRDILDHLPVP